MLDARHSPTSSTLAEGLLALALGGAVGLAAAARRQGRRLPDDDAGHVRVVPLRQGEPRRRRGRPEPGNATVRTDPIRAIQAIATALGFVGAGIVYRDRHEKRARAASRRLRPCSPISPVGVAVALGRPVLRHRRDGAARARARARATRLERRLTAILPHRPSPAPDD